MIFRFTFSLEPVTFYFGSNTSIRVSIKGKTSISEIEGDGLQELTIKGYGPLLSKFHASNAYCEILPISALSDLPIAGYPEAKETLTTLDAYSQRALSRIRDKTNKSIIYINSGNEGPCLLVYISDADFHHAFDVVKSRFTKTLTVEFRLYLSEQNPIVELIQGKPVFVSDFTVRFGEPT